MKNRQEYLARACHQLRKAIAIPADEISYYGFLPPQPALSLMSTTPSRRVAKCLTAIKSDRLLYLSDQKEK